MPPTLTITPLIVTLDVGESLQLQVSPNPNGVKWSCADCHIATVTSEGLVTGLVEGTTIITGRRGNQSVSVSVTVVNVLPPEPPPPPPFVELVVVSGLTVDDLWLFSAGDTAAGEGDSIIETEWSFGDGTPTETYPGFASGNTHLYAAPSTPGTYTATLSILTQVGYAVTTSIDVNVPVGPTPPDPVDPPIPPTAILGFVSGIYAMQPVIFAATAFDDGVIASSVITYGDGHQETQAGLPQPSPMHTYAQPGTYTAELRVTDDDGLVGTATVQVTVVQQPTAPQPPIPILVQQSGAFTGDGFVFSTTGSRDPDGVITSWRFQAGTGVEQSGTGAPPNTLNTVTYATAGTYTARLTLTDNTSLSATITLQVVVTPVPIPGNHPYYDSIVVRPDRRYAWPMHSAAEIATYPKNNVSNSNRIPVYYDPVMDAVTQEVNALVTGSGEPQQVLLPLQLPANTPFLITWDDRWSAGWQWFPDIVPGPAAFIHAEKSTRFDCAPYISPAGRSNPIWLAPKHFLSNSGGPNDEHVFDHPPAIFNWRICGKGDFAVAPASIVGEQVQPIVGSYFGNADTWTRYWVHWNDNKLSVWSASAAAGIVQRVNLAGWIFPTRMTTFRLEDDVSAPGGDALNPQSFHWTRNIVVLAGPTVTYATAVSLLSTVGL